MPSRPLHPEQVNEFPTYRVPNETTATVLKIDTHLETFWFMGDFAELQQSDPVTAQVIVELSGGKRGLMVEAQLTPDELAQWNAIRQKIAARVVREMTD